MAANYLLISILVLACCFEHGDGQACSFPTDLQTGTWLSSDMGDVTFNATFFKVTSIDSFGSRTFECKSITGTRYYSESDAFTFLGSSFKLSICFTLQQLSTYSFVYFPMTPVLSNTDESRIFFQEASYGFTATETCSLISLLPAQARLLVRSGFINESAITCPNAISGQYTYNVTGSSCNDTWIDVCTDRSHVTINRTLCADAIAYSSGGVLSCVWSGEVGGVTYTYLYNDDTTTDEATTYRYTCVAASTVASETYVTMYPRTCLDSMNTTAIRSPGMAAVLTANHTCPGTGAGTAPSSAGQSGSDGNQEALSAGTAVAVVIALLVLLAAVVIVGIWYYIKVHKVKKVTPNEDGKSAKKKVPDFIPAKSPPVDTQVKKKKYFEDGNVSPFSPYPTISEIAAYRFGPPDIDDDDGGITLGATTPGLNDGRRTIYEVDQVSQQSLPMYSEIGGETPEPTRLNEVETRMSEITVNEKITDPTPFSMTRATMNIPQEQTVSPIGPTRLTDVSSRMSEITINEPIAGPSDFTMTNATMSNQRAGAVSVAESTRSQLSNGNAQHPRSNQPGYERGFLVGDWLYVKNTMNNKGTDPPVERLLIGDELYVKAHKVTKVQPIAMGISNESSFHAPSRAKTNARPILDFMPIKEATEYNRHINESLDADGNVSPYSSSPSASEIAVGRYPGGSRPDGRVSPESPTYTVEQIADRRFGSWPEPTGQLVVDDGY